MLSEEKKIHKDYYSEKNFNKLRYEWFKEKFFNNVKRKKILEIGCGDGGVIQYLTNNAVFAVDISKAGIRLLKKKGIKSYLVDVSKEKLPFKNASVDYVMALEVFEHLKSPQNAIEEIQRVLKKRGKLIISIPNSRTGHKFIYPSLFGFSAFKNYLENNGFTIYSKTTYGFCPPFWNLIKSRILKSYVKERKNVNKKEDKMPFLSRMACFMSSKIINYIKPKRYAWSFVYECVNDNPLGAKKVYEEIVEGTKGVYK